MYVNLTHPVHNSMTITFPRPSWSSSMASNFTIFSWFTFCNTSNSRICTSTGRIWDIWLNVLTATGSPLCLFTPYIQTDTNKTIAQCEWWKSKGWTTMAGFEMPYFAIQIYLKNCSGGSFAQNWCRTPDVIGRTA